MFNNVHRFCSNKTISNGKLCKSDSSNYTQSHIILSRLFNAFPRRNLHQHPSFLNPRINVSCGCVTLTNERRTKQHPELTSLIVVPLRHLPFSQITRSRHQTWFSTTLIGLFALLICIFPTALIPRQIVVT